MPDRTGLSGLQRAAIVVGAVVILVLAYVLIQSGGEDDGSGTAATTPATSSAPATTSTPADTATTPETDTAPSTTTTPAEPTVPTIRVVDAKPQGGVRELEFDKGERIRFRVVSDTADEIHVHGYDLAKDVSAGGSVTFSFEGSIDGRFEVELESRGEQIAELDVVP